MPQLPDIRRQIEELDPIDREQLALELTEQILAADLSRPRFLEGRVLEDYSLVVATPDVCGGDARLIRTRIPVWTLERMRQLGVPEVEILRSYPTLKALDLVQAWSYVARHRQEIERAIRENEEGA